MNHMLWLDAQCSQGFTFICASLFHLNLSPEQNLRGTPVISLTRISTESPLSEEGQGDLPSTEFPSLGSGNDDSSEESG